MLDCVVFVSETQRATFRVDTPAQVIGNGIAPAFENIFGSAEELFDAKQNRAIYSSMPLRGLDILIETMGFTKAQTSLDIYSSMRTYQASDKDCAALFRNAERNPRVRQHGAVGQIMLAKAFRSAAFLTYPSTFPETYCIAAQEAMAAGAKVLSVDYGALRETTLGYAELLPMRREGITREELVRGFGVLLERNEADFLSSPRAWAERMFEQVKAVNRVSTWTARAAQWERFLIPIVARNRG
jgi:glycosyltransferase involved in cell wall biosynthesis